MNTFGRIFKVSIFGESHGKAVGVLVDGCPAGIELNEKDFSDDLKRRKGGGYGKTERIEEDRPIILSGVFNGRTTGAPIMVIFENKNVRPADYEALKNLPRPGHADFVAFKKYGGFNDYRGGGHFSGRLTVGLVGAGVIAKKVTTPVRYRAEVMEVGGSSEMGKPIREAKQNGDSVGGIVECVIENVPAGLGEPFFDSVESLLSHIVFSIPGIKGIEFGAGFMAARMRGSEYNDEIIDIAGRTATNNAGGINGGITNGNSVVFRVAVRPTASILKKQKTINLETGKEEEISVKGRHDVCIALRFPVILEAVSAIVFADLMLIEQRVARVFRKGV
ncbi:MAG: chorismate synthase [Candidatus Marinimicrobia bacterium]|nr:chorismate synthase [Candidatus Neomarinimicrobiota bacterium]